MRSTFPSASYPACGDDRMYDLHHGLPVKLRLKPSSEEGRCRFEAQLHWE
jgi:hypothetical protein